MACGCFYRVSCVVTTVVFLLCARAGAQTADPQKLLADGERLAWLRAWTRAEPIFAEAERLFTATGDRRDALYARISRIRGELPRRPVQEVSQQLAEYLDDPL